MILILIKNIFVKVVMASDKIHSPVQLAFFDRSPEKMQVRLVVTPLLSWYRFQGYPLTPFYPPSSFSWMVLD